jgi:hypothetical protein
MNRLERCLRNLLLIALVSWAGVDDFLLVAGDSSDPCSENCESILLFEANGRGKQDAAEDLSPSACTESIDPPIELARIFCAASIVRPLAAKAGPASAYGLTWLRC